MQGDEAETEPTSALELEVICPYIPAEITICSHVFNKEAALYARGSPASAIKKHRGMCLQEDSNKSTFGTLNRTLKLKANMETVSENG